MEKKKVDQSKMIASLSNQISNQAIVIAEREALIQDIGQELFDTKKELEELRKEQIKKMDGEINE